MEILLIGYGIGGIGLLLVILAVLLDMGRRKRVERVWEEYYRMK